MTTIEFATEIASVIADREHENQICCVPVQVMYQLYLTYCTCHDIEPLRRKEFAEIMQMFHKRTRISHWDGSVSVCYEIETEGVVPFEEEAGEAADE